MISRSFQRLWTTLARLKRIVIMFQTWANNFSDFKQFGSKLTADIG